MCDYRNALGAAPGAWTALCAKQVKEVIAIDPAELDPEVVKLENVIHMQNKIEDCIPNLIEQNLLCDLITWDINKHPKAVWKTVVANLSKPWDLATMNAESEVKDCIPRTGFTGSPYAS